MPPARVQDVDAPDAVFLFFTTVVVFDHLKRQIYLIANVRVDEHDDLEAAYRQAGDKIAEIERALAQPTPVPPHASAGGPVEVRSNMGREAYCQAIEKAKEYILAGDIFQVVLSQRLEMDLPAPPFQIYRALRAVNPSPYLYYLKLDDNVVIGSSPEMLVKVEGRSIEYRPIAGTRKRGATDAEDRALAADLLADEKELAEHVMLVDLGRNDVGRVSEYGSVTVPELKIVEYYSHVMHIVSSVRGKLRADRDAFDTLAACFPAGTVSGAPKVRAMEIIAELEPTKRGIYSGSVLYLDFSGNLNSCIAIRTMFVQGRRPICKSAPASWRTLSLKGVGGDDEQGRALLKAVEPHGSCRRDDPRHRQLRFVHLQPRAAPGRAGRRARGAPQRPVTLDEIEALDPERS